MLKKKSFLERLTGSIRLKEEDAEEAQESGPIKNIHLPLKGGAEVKRKDGKGELKWDEEAEAELTVDVYQTPTDIIIQTMVAGVQPDNLSLTITRDMITIRGKREENHSINTDNYFVQELYWGSFSRTISLPEEVDPEEAEAIEKHGLLIIKLPKINKDKETKLKIKSI
jgi:HSP20 family molecular chaperone IbpA